MKQASHGFNWSGKTVKHEKNTLLSIFLALSLLVVSVPQASSAGLSSTGMTLLSSSIEEIRFTVQVPWQSLSLETLQLESGTFTRVSLPGSADLAETGAPQLPLISQMLGVPFGAALGIKITPGRSHTLKIASPVSPVPTQRAEWNDPLTEIEILGLPTLVTSYEPDPTIYAGSGYTRRSKVKLQMMEFSVSSVWLGSRFTRFNINLQNPN